MKARMSHQSLMGSALLPSSRYNMFIPLYLMSILIPVEGVSVDNLAMSVTI